MAYTIFSGLNEKKSTYGNPYVYYTVSYEEISRSGTSAIYKIKIESHLATSASYIGSGTIKGYIRINGGAYKSVTIKSSSDNWSGTGVRTVTLTYTASVSGNPGALNVNFYVTSSDVDSAGKLSTVSTTCKVSNYACVRLKVNGVWKSATPYIKVGGVWRIAVAYIKAGTWKVSS